MRMSICRGFLLPKPGLKGNLGDYDWRPVRAIEKRVHMSREMWAVTVIVTVLVGLLSSPAGIAQPAGEIPGTEICRRPLRPEDRDLLRLHRARREHLWRAEMVQAPHSYDVLHYEINLDIDIPHDSLRTASVLIDCRCETDTLTTVDLDFHGLVIDSVAVNGLFADHTREDGCLLVDLGTAISPGDSFQVAVHYHGQPSHGGSHLWDVGLFIRSWVTYTNCAPYGARYWIPCYDYPSDKATADMNITVPAGYVVASNGKLVETLVDEKAQSATYRWSEGYPISTYLISLAISKYATFSYWYCGQQDTMEIACFVYPADSANAVVEFANLPEMIACYSELFGCYPFIAEKYGMAMVPIGGAMENQTCTSWGFEVLGDQYWDFVVAHELSHQWWGDWVSPGDWREVWLNEGFATYSEALWSEHLDGLPGLRSYMEAVQNTYIQWEGSSGMRFPIYDPPAGYLFSPTEYEKAGSVLHMLRFVVGDTAFFDVLKEYGTTFGGGNAVTGDFQAICEARAGQDLDWFFEQWIYDRGYPEYTYVWAFTPNMIEGGSLDISVAQDQENAPIFEMPVEISISTNQGEIRDTVIVDEAGELFQIVLDSPYTPQDVQLDPDHWLLCKKEGVRVVEPSLVIADWAIDDSQGDQNGWFSPGETVNFTISLQNQGASVFGITAILRTEDEDVQIIDSTASFGYIGFCQSGDNELMPFVLTCPLGLKPHRPFFSLVVRGGGSYADTVTFRLPVGDPTILLVDDDDGGEQDLFYTTLLDSLGYVYELYRISKIGLDSMGEFDQVIWFTAGQDSNTLTCADQDSLAAYLDGGGALLISGSGLGNDIGGSDFYRQYLHANWEGETSTILLQGIADDPISADALVVICGQSGEQDVLVANEDAGTSVCFNYMANGAAAIRHEGDHKVIYLGCGFETVRSDNPSALTAYELMKRILNWFEDVTPVRPEEFPTVSLPSVFALAQNYPNPFNASTRITFQVPGLSRVELRIFNIRGQEVKTLLDENKTAGDHVLLWDGTDDRGEAVASGIYFCQMWAGEYRRTQKMLLLR